MQLKTGLEPADAPCVVDGVCKPFLDTIDPMKPMVKKALLAIGVVVGLIVVAAFVFVWSQVAAFDASLEAVYEIPVSEVRVSNEPQVLSRGKHLVRSSAGCALANCHGADLAGGRPIDAGPLGTMVGPNITGAGLGAVYTDGELKRLIEHGIRKDGRSVRFMPSHEINWAPESDIAAIISYVRSAPDVSKAAGTTEVGLLGKILDRQDMFVWDVARRINHEQLDKAPEPSPAAEYGRYLAKSCVGCHGETYGGGPLPGAPPEMPIPTNITPHATGLVGYQYEQFSRLCDEGTKRDGQKLDPFMPVEAMRNMNETERQALFAYLTSLPPKPFGSR